MGRRIFATKFVTDASLSLFIYVLTTLFQQDACHLYYNFWWLRWNQAGTGRALQSFGSIQFEFELYIVLQISAGAKAKSFLSSPLMPILWNCRGISFISDGIC
jgi:hypothetical protein